MRWPTACRGATCWSRRCTRCILDGVLIPAAALVNGVSIVQLEAVEQVEYFHLELDTPRRDPGRGRGVGNLRRRRQPRHVPQRGGIPPAVSRTRRASPARYCAPRVEDGERAGGGAPAPRRPGGSRGADEPSRRAGERCRLPGSCRAAAASPAGRATWQRPTARCGCASSTTTSTIGEIVADRYRADLRRDRASATGATVSSSASRAGCRRCCAMSSGCSARRRAELPNSPWRWWSAAPLALTGAGGDRRGDRAAWPAGPRHARADRRLGAGRRPIRETPVALQILDNGVPIARVLANRGRDGPGRGRDRRRAPWLRSRHPRRAVAARRHVIQVRREADGAELPGSPAVIEAAGGFDADLQQTIANAVAAVGADDDQDRVLSFMLQQADRLLQQRADAEAQRTGRLAHRDSPAPGPLGTRRPGQRRPRIGGTRRIQRRPARAGDRRTPAGGRPRCRLAGDPVAHARAAAPGLCGEFRGGGRDGAGRGRLAALAAAGVTCCAAPFYAGVEDVLRRQADCFDVVYLHRVGIATRYLGAGAALHAAGTHPLQRRRPAPCPAGTPGGGGGAPRAARASVAACGWRNAWRPGRPMR